MTHSGDNPVTSSKKVIVALVVVVLLCFEAYSERKKQAILRAQIQTLSERLDVASNTLQSVLDERFKSLESSLQQRVQSLESKQQDAISAFEEQIKVIETKLTPQSIIKTLVSEEEGNDFPSIVAEHLWFERHSDIAKHPALIASTAAKVYEKYGDDLRGESGSSASANEIAKILANEPGFADLVVYMQSLQRAP